MRQRKSCVLSMVACVVTVGAMLLTPATRAADTFKALHAFTSAKNPSGNLIFDAAGNLYGTTISGGGSGCGGDGCGVVWKLKPNPSGSWTVSILHVFTGTDGANPYAGLTFDRAGNLYGTTSVGGLGVCVFSVAGCGVIFKLAPNPNGTWTESVLHSFTDAPDGSFPQGGLVFDAAGNLYGTTKFGGSSTLCGGCGVVFKLKPNSDETWTESVLHSFDGLNGLYPMDRLVFDADGNLYGTTYGGGPCGHGELGCGVVFKLTPSSDGTWTESVLHNFTGPDGISPEAGLIFDAAGNLYGTTIGGGPSSACVGCGVVFKLTPNPDGTWTESLLHNFTGADGNWPATELVFDGSGNLYGTTVYGGCYTACPSNGCGVVFKLTPNSDETWTESVLHTFVGYGRFPTAPVLLDQAGNLYGTTSSGNNNSGLVFEIAP